MTPQAATRNKVEAVGAHGEVVFRAEDGTYVLAQQIDAKPLHDDQVLLGRIGEIGVSDVADPETGAAYQFFVEAYGLSREAALQGKSWNTNGIPSGLTT